MISPKLVGLSGVMGSGKTFRRNELIKQGFVPIDFKDELIRLAEDILGYKITDNYDLFKETVLGCTIPGIPMTEDVQRLASKRFLQQFPNAVTGRIFLQRLGTEAMRTRDSDYWIKAWNKKVTAALKERKSVVTADVRFQNEVDAIYSFRLQSFAPIDVCVIFCDYKSERYNADSDHPSEMMAQNLIQLGLKDGDAVPYRGMETYS